jgi:UDP-N-acetylglucosamine 2-epimerase
MKSHQSYERPEAMEEAVTMLTGFNIKLIDNALLILESQKRAKLRTLKIVDDYNVNNVSEKVVRIILSYIDYINSKIWMKNSNE